MWSRISLSNSLDSFSRLAAFDITSNRCGSQQVSLRRQWLNGSHVKDATMGVVELDSSVRYMLEVKHGDETSRATDHSSTTGAKKAAVFQDIMPTHNL